MGDFVSGLFGGAQSEQKPADITSPELASTRNPFAALLLGLLGAQGPQQGESVIPGSPNPRATVTPNPNVLGGIPSADPSLLGIAGLGANETALLDQLMRQGTGARSPVEQNQRRMLNQTLKGRFLPGEDQSNPFLQAMIEAAQRPTLEGLQEQLERSLPGRFTQAGQFTQPQGSSAFDRAAAIATRGATQAMSDIATNLSGQAYESERTRQFAAQEGERGRQLQAAEQAAQLSQQEVDRTIQNLQAQALPRLIQQHGMDRGLQEFQRQTEMLVQVLSILGGVTAPTSTAIGSSSESPNIAGTLLSPFSLGISR